MKAATAPPAFARQTEDYVAVFAENEMIGEYTVISCFYHGSYYESYTAFDRKGNTCFIKVILPDMVKPSGFDRDGSVIEGEIASLLSGDPDLGHFLGSGTVEKDGKRVVYIATRWAREMGTSLCLCGVYLEVKRPDRHWLEQLMQWVLTALDRLHSKSRPVIHNEVEPGNIMIDDGDFRELSVSNRARFSDLEPDPGSWHGLDPHFVAPERMAGGGSVRSDIFSAGALMYWVVFGIKPWDSEIDTVLTEGCWAMGYPEDDPDATVQTVWKEVRSFIRNRKGPLPIPEKMLIDIDDRQLEAMKKALSVDPEKRFQSAPEFMDALGIKDQPDGIDEVLSQSAGNQVKDPGEAAGAARKKASGNTPEPRRARGNGFADVAGMEDLKSMMREKIIDVLKDPELAEKYRIQIPNGMLLYGPPGCGKSFIAEKFAEEAGWNYKLIKSSDLASTYIHGSQEKIGKLFDEARKNAPMILNFDEFDALVPDRGRSGSVDRSGEVNEFLSQMNNCGKDRVFVIASSNRPDLIDPAVRRKGRLDQMIYIPVPDAAAREGMFRVQMKGRPQEEGIDFGHLASLTENYVSADIAFIVNDAAEKAFRSRSDITESMLEEAIKKTPPSVGPDDIRYYESLREKIEKSAKESAHSPIGFIQD